MLPVKFHPISDFFEWTCIKPAWTPLCISTASNQARPFQHLEVLRNPRKGHFEGLRQFSYRRFTPGEPRKYRAPCGVREGRKGPAKMICRHIYYTERLINRLVKYTVWN